MSSASKKKMTPAEYLQFERTAVRDKHFYFQGEIFAMTGASRHHVRICVNLISQIHKQLDDSECEVMNSDMRVKNERTGSYFYPDVIATCHSPKFEDDQFDTLLNPQVIIEVLSDSTESFDRGGKFQDYQQLESLKEYILVSQKKMLVERYTRKDAPTWEYSSSSDPDAELELNSIDCRIKLSDIYTKVEFPEPDDEGDLKVIEDQPDYNVPKI